MILAATREVIVSSSMMFDLNQNLVASQGVVYNEPFLHTQLQKHYRLKLLKS